MQTQTGTERVMNGWSVLKIAIGVAVVAVIAVNMPDVIRYIRISTM
jgi:hypothetical protein